MEAKGTALTAALFCKAYFSLCEKFIALAEPIPGFRNYFDEIAAQIILEIKNTPIDGATFEDEADSIRSAVEQLEKQFNHWRDRLTALKDGDPPISLDGDN